MGLSGCGSDKLAGNSVETENISARVLSVDSLLPSWNHPDTGGTVGTLRFDASDFDFSHSTPDGRDLRLERLDSTLLPFEIVEWDQTARLGRVRVRLDSSLLQPGARFRLRWGLPNPKTLSNPAATWEGIDDSLVLALTSVLVDDFRIGNDTTLLPTHPVWNAYASDSASVLGFAFPAAGAGFAGMALHLQYQAAAPRYAVATTTLVQSGVPRSLRVLDSLVFWVRGSGNFWVAFDHLTNGSGPKAWMSVSLDSVWTRVRMRPQDLDTADGVGGNIGWDGVRDSVTDLAFIVNSGGDLWLDSVRLYGPDRDDLK